MVFKFVVLLACVAAGNAAILAHHTPLAYAAGPVVATPVAKAIDTEYDPHPQYSYAYDVQDGITGDSKGQHETRDGDLVQGSYNLLEADGTRRIVDYTADPINGFNAVVRKEPAGVAAVVASAPVAYSAPAIAKVHAPVAYAAPAAIAKVHAAPVAYAAPAYAHAAYAAPAIAKVHTPVAYAAHAAYAAAPAYAAYAAPAYAKIHAPVAYASPAAYAAPAAYLH